MKRFPLVAVRHLGLDRRTGREIDRINAFKPWEATHATGTLKWCVEKEIPYWSAIESQSSG
jgi:hypothetical protein